MRKTYLLIYSDAAGTREQVKAWANSTPLVLIWRYDLPNCFYLVSERSARELATSFRENISGTQRFLIAEVTDDREGWLPKETWHLLRNKTLMSKKGT